MKNDIVKLGIAIKKLRRDRGMTMKALAEKAGVSIGLVSKIENFRTIPSLPVLLEIANGLQITVSELVKDISVDKAPYLIVRKEDKQRIEREAGRGMTYDRILDWDFTGSHFQSFLVTLDEGGRRENISTDGDEFLFMIKGAMTLVLGDEKLELREGDSICFDGSIPHAPINGDKCGETVFLAIYLLKHEE